MLLEPGANVTADTTLLESNGAGALHPRTTGQAVAVAKQTLNNTSGANAWFLVEIL
jgi:hypothetical protein